ncbi:MAG: hypothetical protein Q4F95_01220 [Oscillospiraceae bacterium]|nr:hypothetical protein [Oscillospiraceae bacterium]
MRNLASFWFSLLVFPLMFFICIFSGLFMQSEYADVILLTYSNLILFSGTLFRFFIYRFERRRKKLVFLAEFITGTAICLIPCLFTGDNKSTLFFITFVLFFAGFRLYAFDYAKMINPNPVVISSSAYILFVIFYVLSNVSFSAFRYYFIYTLMIAVYFVIKNQTNLDRLMESRSYDKKYLSRQTRTYNLKMVLFLCIIMFILVILRKPAGAVLGFLIKGLIGSLVCVLRLIRYLLDRNDTDDSIIKKIQQFDDETGQQISGNAIAKYISFLFVILFDIFLIYKFRRFISFFFKHTYARILRHIRTIFAPKDKNKTNSMNLAYTDQYETITEIHDGSHTLSQKKQIVKWRKEYRKISSIKDSTRRYRNGYRLAAQAIRLLGYKVTASDTPTEVISKYNTRKYDQAARLYNCIRYNSYNCSDNELSNLMTLLKDLDSELSEHKNTYNEK